MVGNQGQECDVSLEVGRVANDDAAGSRSADESVDGDDTTIIVPCFEISRTIKIASLVLCMYCDPTMSNKPKFAAPGGPLYRSFNGL